MKKTVFLLPLTALLVSCAPTENVPVHNYGGTTGVGTLGVHTVKGTDTVWRISQNYNVPLRSLLDLNNLAPPYQLNAGQRLMLPAPQTYRVRGNESLYSISRLYNVSVTDLVRQNKLVPPYKLTPGTVLSLPSAQGATVADASFLPPSIMPPGPEMPVGPAVVPSIDAPEILASPLSPPPVSIEPPQPAPMVSTPASIPPEPVKIPETPTRVGKFLKPVDGPILSGYGPKPDGSHNDGLNIQATRGTAVRAAENGVVVYADNAIEGYGNLILLRHADGYVTAYAHLDKMLVKRGAKIRRGEAIGTVGKTGSADKPQLHFEIRRGAKAIDPKSMI